MATLVRRYPGAVDAISEKLQQGAYVKVGFLKGGRYPDGTSIPLVAAINEFGRGPGSAVQNVGETEKAFHRRSIAFEATRTEFGEPLRGQPPRPYFRRMVADKKATWGDVAANLLRKNGADIPATLDKMGQGIVGQLQQSINNLTEPPLAPSTIARKGFDKPLIDTKVMLNAVSYQVVTPVDTKE